MAKTADTKAPFGSMTPAQLYHQLVRQVPLLQHMESLYDSRIPPEILAMSNPRWSSRGEAYFARARLPNQNLVDAGIVVDCKASPDVYVVTAANGEGELSSFPFRAEGDMNRRTLRIPYATRILNSTKTLAVGAEDLFHFGSSLSWDDKCDLLLDAVRAHYAQHFGGRMVVNSASGLEKSI